MDKPFEKSLESNPRPLPRPKQVTFSSTPMLTPSEIAQLKRNGNEQRDFGIKEFGLKE